MKIYFLNRIVQIVVILGPFAPPNAFAQTANETSSLVVPPGLGASFGDTFAGDFLFFGGRSIEAFGTSLFDGANSDIINISGIAFRVDEASKGSVDVVIPHLALSLGVYAGPISNFPNQGTPLSFSTVLDKSNLRISAKLGLPQEFNIVLSFDRPFTYDRRSGQLMLQSIRTTSTGIISDLDGQTSAEGVYYSQVDGTPVTSSVVPVIKVFYNSVPESSPSILGVFGGAIIFALNWYRGREKA